MRNALRAALHLRVQEADQTAAAARARMEEILRAARQQGGHLPKDLDGGHQLDEVVRELELARAHARGVKETCAFITIEVLGEKFEDEHPLA